MKKSSFVAMLLSVAAFVGGTASAATLATYTHTYGSALGQVDPLGNDSLGSGYVTVSDQSSSRFSDSFNFNSLSFNSISSFVLTLNYADIGQNPFSELWSERPGGLTNPGYFSFNLPSAADSTTVSSVFTIDSNTNTFGSMVAAKDFFFWFAESTLGSDSFRLNSAELKIMGAVPEPEQYAMLLAGLGLIGAIARRRKANTAA